MTTTAHTVNGEENEPQLKPYYYFETPFANKVHHFYISDGIGEPGHYVDMIHTLKMAGPNDIIYMYLNTPGGMINTGIQIISAMNLSQAHIVTVLEGEVCSLGTLLFLSGDEFIVHDHCLFMIHNYSGGTYGKGHEQAAQVEAYQREFGDLAKDIYADFLTEDEIHRVLKGEDLWMGSGEVRTRLTNMIKAIEKARKELEKAERTPKRRTSKKKAVKKSS